MIRSEAETLARGLSAVFDEAGTDVAVGLTRTGVAIRSQTPDVDARNTGPIRALNEVRVQRRAAAIKAVAARLPPEVVPAARHKWATNIVNTVIREMASTLDS